MILNTLFGDPIDPKTPVEVWSIHQYDYVFKVKLSVTSLEDSPFKHLLKSLHKTKDKYGPQKPVIIVVNNLNPKPIFSAMALEEFDVLYGKIATLSPEGLVRERDKYGEALTNAVEKMKEIHESMKV